MPQTKGTLYIRLGVNDISFALYDPQADSAFTYASVHVNPMTSLSMNIRRAIEQVPFAQLNYQRVRVLVEGECTLVPTPVFYEEDAETIYRLAFPYNRKGPVYYDSLPHLDAVLLFGLEENAYHALKDVYPGLFCMSSTTSVLLHFSALARGENGNKLYVYIQDHFMHVFAYNQGRLQLCNCFTVRAVNDMVYYLLQVVRLLGFDQRKEEIFLTGKWYEQDRFIEKMRDFVPHTFYIAPSAEFNRHIVTMNQENVPYDLITLLVLTR